MSVMNSQVQPVLDISSLQQVENIVTGNVDPLALALGYNNIITNNSSTDLLAVWSLDLRTGVVLGAGVTVAGFLAYRAQPGPGSINPTVQLSDRISYTVGDSACWGWMAPANSPLILLPGESAGFWLTTLAGGGPNTFASSRSRVLTS